MRPAARWSLRAAALIALVLLLAFDRPLSAAVSGVRSAWLTQWTEWISEVRGVPGFAALALLVAAAGLVGRKPRLRRAGLAMLIGVLLSGAIVFAVKPVVARDGPLGPVPPEPGESWLSARWGRFPSGHTAAAFAAAAGLASVYPATAPAGYAIAALVGYERIYRRVHFAGDCLAGAWIGIETGTWAARRLSRRNGRKEALAPVSRRSPAEPVTRA